MIKKLVFFYSLIVLLFVFGLSATALSQAQLDWNALADVKYAYKYYEAYDTEYLTPVFGETPTTYSNKTVLISGYLIPLGFEEDVFVLSKTPYSSCFFCGNEGPETIIELWIKPNKMRRYKIDEFLTFKGKLLLNDSNIDHFNYILEEAEEYSAKAK